MTTQTHDLLNVPTFQTDLFIPKYNDGETDNWKISHMKLGFDHGYFTDTWAVENMAILSRRSDDDPDTWESWMSICPHELESQEICCKHAEGNVAIIGLGMGWVAINTAFNEKVDKVFVIDNDYEVIKLFHHSGALTGVPSEIIDKIRIIHANGMEWFSEVPIDLLYIDIWKNLVEPQTLSDVKRMQKNIKAEKVYFWGQELFLFREFYKEGLEDDKLNMKFIREEIKNMGIPLFIPEGVDYASVVLKAGQQRLKRKLPLFR